MKESYNKRKIKILIDSDVANEIDDKFAISYALSKLDAFDVLGITLAPYNLDDRTGLSIRDAMLDSKNEALRILRLFGFKYDKDNPCVYMGCDNFLDNGYNKTNPAVNKIIELAKSNKSIVICCLGTLTNVAMALNIQPEIASKIKIVWLGTDSLLLDKFEDFNFNKDKSAFYKILNSNVDLTIFPMYLARNFLTSPFEFERNAKKNNISKYLLSFLTKPVSVEEGLGVKAIYSIGPISYLLNKNKFTVKKLNAKLFVKDKGIKVSADKLINCIINIPDNNFVWENFIEAINLNKNYYLKPEIFFTSDTHFNHVRKVIKKQVPFKSVEEMNRELVRRWNNKVAPDDIVYHLGDFGDYNFIKKLNGKVILICGNYEEKDFCGDFDFFRKRLIDLGFFDVVKDGMYLDKNVLGEKIYLVHKPTCHAKDCFSLFGHVHSLALVKPFGFNVCTTYHYFAPLDRNTVKKYLNFVEYHADEDVFVE